MVLRLDPRFPLVWRTPTSLQIGVSAPPVVLRNVSSATERMLAALAIGVTRPGISLLGTKAGASERYIAELLTTLSPVLVSDSASRDHRSRGRTTVGILGVGAVATRISNLLAEAGIGVIELRNADEAAATECDLAIAVGHFVLSPSLHGIWLRQDVPHVPVVIGDSEVNIGPIVEPGSGPCLYCLELHATDADPAWPAIASQLLGRRSQADNPLIASEVAAIVCRLVLARLVGEREATHESQHLSVDSGIVSLKYWHVHPACGCLEAGSANGEARQEIGWVDAEPDVAQLPRRWQTTRESAASALA